MRLDGTSAPLQFPLFHTSQPVCLTPPKSPAYSAPQGIPRRFCASPPFSPRTGFLFMAKGTFGERLKREREMREVTLDELTKATRISPRFLNALENEAWDQLPGGVFGRGFVRTIARYLGLGEESLLAEYDMAHGEQKTEAPAPYENRLPRPPKWVPALALLVFLSLLVGLYYAGRYAWHRYTAHRAQQRSSASTSLSVPGSMLPISSPTSSPTSSPASVSPASTSQAPKLDLAVSTSAATRIRIMADNALLLDAELPAGETRHFSAALQFQVTAGDSSAVLLELNGQAMPPLGTPGSSGTMVLSQKDLRQASGGNAQR
jgi:cytoskeleton protein RodZ